MPVIHEEQPTISFDSDFAELLDFPGSAFLGAGAAFTGTKADNELSQLPHDDMFIDGWDASAPVVETGDDLDEPDYSKFENWIPRFIRPAKPCDYCRSKRLDCYLQRGEVSCTPCKTLFRECSLNTSHTLESMNYNNGTVTGTFLDTLHIVDEETARERGTFTGIKPMNSKGRASGTTTPVHDDEPGSSKRNGIRFPRHAVKVLRDWLDSHSEHPYPTEYERTRLENQTELKSTQIANWLANARRRRKVGEKKPKMPMSPSLRPTTPSIEIPSQKKAWEELNPFERWKNSPPENEPASITDIAQAVANNDLQEELGSASPGSSRRVRKRSSNGSGFASYRAPSTTSLDTSAQTSSLSASSAAFSHGSSHSHGSFASFSSSLAGKKDRRRRNRHLQAMLCKQSDDRKRIFQCTFCTDTFKSKYDWTRHEKSLHLSLEKWICAPLGPIITDMAVSTKTCAYCEAVAPSEDHIESHNHRQCEVKGMDARTFYRKDHLRQHMRLMHGCEMSAAMNQWKSIAVNINSRCGFCAQRFSTWQERVDHLTAHFKAGAKMAEWRGCRGLDPAIAAQVTNAMPPYLIGLETVSPNPFSATNRSSWRQACDLTDNPAEICSEVLGLDESGRQSTCWEVLTVRLGRFANEMAQQSVVLTDDMLQQRARHIVFGSNDSWNQTPADHPEWLDLFKKAHGLDYIPTAVGGQGRNVPEDLETYGDLGLRIPFAAQLHALNNQQALSEIYACSEPREDHLQARITVLRAAHTALADSGVLHDEDFRCGHAECANNLVEVSYFDQSTTAPQHIRWCGLILTPELAEHAARLRSVVPTMAPELASRLEAQEGDIQTISRADEVRTLECTQNSTSGSVPAVVAPKNFLQRHRYELPEDRASYFATVTGAWAESGEMPAAVITTASSPASPSLGLYPTTGAMMEFLGGQLGNALPFSQDAATSTIAPGPQKACDPAILPWLSNDELTMKDLDDLIAATTDFATDPNLATAPGMASGDVPLDTSWLGEDIPVDDIFMNKHDNAATALAPRTSTGDLDMDMDMDMDMDIFDGVFDMPLDETFEFHS